MVIAGRTCVVSLSLHSPSIGCVVGDCGQDVVRAEVWRGTCDGPISWRGAASREFDANNVGELDTKKVELDSNKVEFDTDKMRVELDSNKMHGLRELDTSKMHGHSLCRGAGYTGGAAARVPVCSTSRVPVCSTSRRTIGACMVYN